MRSCCILFQVGRRGRGDSENGRVRPYRRTGESIELNTFIYIIVGKMAECRMARGADTLTAEFPSVRHVHEYTGI